MPQHFSYLATARLRLANARDDRAPGAAITVDLCGHWEHEGPCRWPHRTDARRKGDLLEITTRFETDPEDEPEVRRRIEAVLARGELKGPDGRTTSWERVSAQD